MKHNGEAEMTGWNKCPGCGTTVNGSADYCPNCSEPWTVKCSRCGVSWRFWKLCKFCPDCGAPVENRGNIQLESGELRAVS